MIDIDPNNLEAKVAAINFTLRHYVPERLGTLQMMLTGHLTGVDFRRWTWSEMANTDLTIVHGNVSSLYIQQGAIPALRDEIWKQCDQALDEFNRVCRYRCELVDVQLLVDLGDGNLKLMPKAAPITAPGC